MRDDLVDRIGEALDLDALLGALLAYGSDYLGCRRASAFAWDSATRELRLQRFLSGDPPPLSFGSGEGIVGRAWKKGVPALVEGQELQERYLVRGPFELEHRAIFAFPYAAEEGFMGVLCFDILEAGAGKPQPLSDLERTRIAFLTDRLQDPRVRNALRRARIVNGHNRVRSAGSAQYKFRQEVGRYLERFSAAFEPSGWQRPALAYFQLVDRRQKKIRTIQGFGLPLSAQVSISHSLDSDDIQAWVVESGSLELIEGFHHRFDRAVYDRYGHAAFVRLWLPLFPFPTQEVTHWGRHRLSEELGRRLKWSAAERDGEAVRQSGAWPSELCPPRELIFGTLEIGYERPRAETRLLSPWTRELAAFCTSQALEHANELFAATLAGSLDTIAREVAGLAAGCRVSMAVTLPDRTRCERRTYPLVDRWPASPPEVVKRQVGTPAPLVEWSYLQTGPPTTPEREDLRTRTERIAEDAIRVALRLDDQLVDTFSLVELVEEPNASFGTLWPDPWLRRFCQDAAHETGASRCHLFLFEGKEGQPTVGLGVQRIEELSPPASSASPERLSERDRWLAAAAKRVADTGKPEYLPEGEARSAPWGLVPLELADGLTALACLEFQPGTVDVSSEHDRFGVEARVVRWVHRLSLRRLVSANRFAALLAGLRGRVAGVRRDSVREGEERLVAKVAHSILQECCEELRGRSMPVRAAIATLSRSGESGPDILERFYVADRDKGSFRSIYEQAKGPCRLAIETGRLLVYPPKERGCSEEAREVLQMLVEAADRSSTAGAGALRGLADLLREESSVTTVVVIPTRPYQPSGAPSGAALTLILEGHQCFSLQQQRQLLELGDLVGRTLEEARELDRRWLVDQATGAHQWRAEIDRAENLNDVLASAIDVLGRMKSLGEDRRVSRPLAAQGVLWLLSRDLSELVPRVSWGLEAEAKTSLAPAKPFNHPLLSREWASIQKSKAPRLEKVVSAVVLSAKDLAGRADILPEQSRRNRWWVSAPLAGGDGRLLGVIDLLLAEPPIADVHDVISDLTRRLGRQVVSAVTRSHLERSEKLARRLNRQTAGLLRGYQLAKLWKLLAEACREELGCQSCDLFLDYMSDVVLRATTREDFDVSRFNPLDLWIKPALGAEPIGATLAGQRPFIARATETKASKECEHVSPALQQLLTGSRATDWLLVPLLLEEEVPKRYHRTERKGRQGEGRQAPETETRASRCEGLLLARGPFTRRTRLADPAKAWSDRADQQDVELARGLGRVVQRIAKVVQVVEEQSALTNEMVHNLAHPLEDLRLETEDLLRDLQVCGGGRLKERKVAVDEAFQLVEESREQLRLLAKLGQPKILDAPKEIDLCALVNDCARTWQRLAAERTVRLFVEPAAPLTIVGHARWLRQATSNVIHNAVKYSFANREVTITVQRSRRGATISAHDYGVGIPQEDLDRVFDLYTRSRVPDAKGERPGMGVGLAIVRDAVALHRGTAVLECKPRNGRALGRTAEAVANIEHSTTLTITLPYEE